MAYDMKYSQESGARANPMERRRHLAWILILIGDAGFVVWVRWRLQRRIYCLDQVARRF